jgi:type IV secretory pathway VirB2 component (pilin)
LRNSSKPLPFPSVERSVCGVAERSPGGVALVEAGVGLGEEEDRAGVALLGLLEGLTHPLVGGPVARLVLGRVRGHVAEVVVRPHHVQAGVDHPPDAEADVLDVGLLLLLESKAPLAKGPRPVEEVLADVLEPLARGVALAVAVGPLVVAGGVHRGGIERVEERLGLCVDVVGALRSAALDVPGEGRREQGGQEGEEGSADDAAP